MPTRRTFLIAAAAIPAIAVLPGSAAADEPSVYASDGIAINGYDPVAYFTERRALKGNPEFASPWDGATLHFATARNKAMFDASPASFAPAYGGYCAYAVSRGYIADTDPQAWTIYDDRLYLNYSKSVRALWSLNKSGHVASADANWPAVLRA